jgi:hypothetical protein
MGATGGCKAVIAEVVEGAEAVETIDCGSVFAGGHIPLGAFLRPAQVPASAAGGAATPFACCDDAAETVEVEEACDDCDDSDEVELDRCEFFRGMNMAVLGMLALLHRWFGKFGGGATAVIDGDCAGRLPYQRWGMRDCRA